MPLRPCPDCGGREHLGEVPCGGFASRIATVAIDYHPTASVDPAGLGHSTRRVGREGQRRWTQRLERYASLARSGVAPKGVTHRDMDVAEARSEAGGAPFRADSVATVADPQEIVNRKMAELSGGTT